MIAGAADVLKWLRAVQARPELTHAERCAAFALALRINGHTGRLNPSKSTVGADSGTSETVAKRTIAKLQAAELVAVEGSNGRTSNSYALTLPEAPNPAATGPVECAQPGRYRTRPLQTRNPAATDPPTRPLPAYEQKKEQKKNREEYAPTKYVGRVRRVRHRQNALRTGNRTIARVSGSRASG